MTRPVNVIDVTVDVSIVVTPSVEKACANVAYLSRFDYVTCAWFFTALMYSVISDRLAS